MQRFYRCHCSFTGAPKRLVWSASENAETVWEFELSEKFWAISFARYHKNDFNALCIRQCALRYDDRLSLLDGRLTGTHCRRYFQRSDYAVCRCDLKERRKLIPGNSRYTFITWSISAIWNPLRWPVASFALPHPPLQPAHRFWTTGCYSGASCARSRDPRSKCLLNEK